MTTTAEATYIQATEFFEAIVGASNPQHQLNLAQAWESKSLHNVREDQRAVGNLLGSQVYEVHHHDGRKAIRPCQPTGVTAKQVRIKEPWDHRTLHLDRQTALQLFQSLPRADWQWHETFADWFGIESNQL